MAQGTTELTVMRERRSLRHNAADIDDKHGIYIYIYIYIYVYIYISSIHDAFARPATPRYTRRTAYKYSV